MNSSALKVMSLMPRFIRFAPVPVVRPTQGHAALVQGKQSGASVKLHLSDVKVPIMDRQERSDFLKHLTGQVFFNPHQAEAAMTLAQN